MEPSAVIPNYDQIFPLKDDSRGSRRPSNLTLSSITSSKARTPEPSPTKSRFRENGDMPNDMITGIVKGPFMYVGPEKKRFHAKRSEAPYPLPCGLEELSRMNMLHYVLYNVFDERHYLTEFKAGELPKRVLDIGCGTGIWIHDVAKTWTGMGHTEVEFVGVDLVPIQTPMRDVNVTFHYLNILTEELPFEDGYFDYVHIRCLAAGIPENCWLGDHKSASGVIDKALRVLRLGGYFEVMESITTLYLTNIVNLLFSYFDVSVSPPKQIPLDMVLSKEDTIAPVLSKMYTGRKHTLSPTVDLGINPLPLSILSAQFTFLPLTQLHTARKLIPVARFNVPMIRLDEKTPEETTPDDVTDSVSRVAGYIASGEMYISLKPELLRILKEENRGDPYGELKRIEQRSHRRWLGMEIPDHERRESVISDHESVRKVLSSESTKAKSVNSELSKSSNILDWQMPSAEKGDAASDKVQLQREVGAWWGMKSAE